MLAPRRISRVVRLWWDRGSISFEQKRHFSFLAPRSKAGDLVADWIILDIDDEHGK
jgi:hypothetical protein